MKSYLHGEGGEAQRLLCKHNTEKKKYNHNIEGENTDRKANLEDNLSQENVL